MSEEFSGSLTPPCSPYITESLELLVTEQCIPPRFSCAPDKCRNGGKSFSGDSYLSTGSLKRLLLKLDPSPTDYESDTVEIFGFPWVTETALVESSDMLFGLLRQKINTLESLTQPVSFDFGQTNKIHSEAVEIRNQCSRFLHYVKVFIYRFLESEKVTDDGSLHPYEEMEAQLPSKLIEELNGLCLYIGRLNELPSNILGAFTIQHHGKVFPATWHLLHLHLDIHWSILEILHILGDKMQGQVVYAHQFINLIGENLTNVGLFKDHCENLICDLIGLAASRYTKVRPSEALNSHPYPCLCIKELWILIVYLLDHRSKGSYSECFWNWVNTLLRSLLGESSGTETPNISGVVQCKDSLGLSWWLMSHLSLLYQFDRNGNQDERIQIESNWKFVEELLKKSSNVQNVVLEDQLRMHLQCCLSLCEIWESNLPTATILWEYYSKNLNSAFNISWLGVRALASVSKTPFSMLEVVKNCCADEHSSDLYKSDNSYLIFLRIMGRLMKKSKDTSGTHPWKQIKGRIYSKFHQKKMQELTEVGLQNFFTLFLLLATLAETEDVTSRVLDLLNFLVPNHISMAQRTLVWRGHFAFLLVYVEKNMDITALAEKLSHNFQETAKEFLVLKSDFGQKHILWTLLSTYVDGVQEVFETSRNLQLSEEKLLNEGFSMLLPACRESELSAVLHFLQTVIARLRKDVQEDIYSFNITNFSSLYMEEEDTSVVYEGEFSNSDGIQIESNWKFVEELLKKSSNVQNVVLEDQLRMHLQCCLSLCEIWESNLPTATILWEYYSKNLNSAFNISWLGVRALASVSKTPFSMLEVVKNCCADEHSSDLYKSDSSYLIFLRIMGRLMKKSKDTSGTHPWKQIKGRIYSKFHQKKMQELTEVGLQNFFTLFLLLATLAETEDVTSRVLDLLNFLVPNHISMAQRTLVWRGHFAFLLVYVEKNMDITALAEKLSHNFQETAKEFLVLKSDFGQKHILWTLLSTYVDGVQEVFETSRNLQLSEEKLLNEGFSMLLPACRESELSAVLHFLQTVIARLRNLHERSSKVHGNPGMHALSVVKECHLAVASALWRNFFPFLKSLRLSQTPPSQLADTAAGYTLLALDMPSSAPSELQPQPFVSMMHLFGWDDMIIPQLVSRFLSHLMPNSILTEALSSMGYTSYQALCIRAWIRCVLQIFIDQPVGAAIRSDSEITMLLTEQLGELSRLVFKLPEVENILCKGKIDPKSNKQDPKSAILQFIKGAGVTYSSLQTLVEKSTMVSKCLEYLGDILKYVKPYLTKKGPVEGLQITYRTTGCIVKYWALMLATSKAQQFLFRIIDFLLLPHALYHQDKGLPPAMLSAIRESLPLFLQGLSIISRQSQTQGAYVKQQLKTIIQQYFGRFLPSAPSVAVTGSHPMLLAVCESVQSLHTVNLRRTVMQVISDSYLQFKGHAPPPRLASILSFILDVFQKSKTVDVGDADIILPSILKCFMLVNDPQATTAHILNMEALDKWEYTVTQLVHNHFQSLEEELDKLLNLHGSFGPPTREYTRVQQATRTRPDSITSLHLCSLTDTTLSTEGSIPTSASDRETQGGNGESSARENLRPKIAESLDAGEGTVSQVPARVIQAKLPQTRAHRSGALALSQTPSLWLDLIAGDMDCAECDSNCKRVELTEYGVTFYATHIALLGNTLPWNSYQSDLPLHRQVSTYLTEDGEQDTCWGTSKRQSFFLNLLIATLEQGKQFVQNFSGTYDHQVYGILETLSVLDQSLVIRLIPTMTQSLKEQEYRRGQGRNASSREAYKRLLSHLGEPGLAELQALDYERS
ncbi:protein MMS22-like [Bombina bombina]|uniref:protein MMS22-like n=1 Tax=Bombina bombina TaxID=8345 RepID=UPI00235A6633|nr:protein MMS22-like [Bombina bombina]